MNQLKVFVDLAIIQAGETDLEIDRVWCFHGAAMGYAPIIFDLSKESNCQDLLDTCKKVWAALENDPELPLKLVILSVFVFVLFLFCFLFCCLFFFFFNRIQWNSPPNFALFLHLASRVKIGTFLIFREKKHAHLFPLIHDKILLSFLVFPNMFWEATMSTMTAVIKGQPIFVSNVLRCIVIVLGVKC